jgi:outer membrane protein insertion porin family
MILYNRHILLSIFFTFTFINVFFATFLYSQPAAVTGKIEFTGNSNFSSKELHNFIATKEKSIYSKQQFELDLKNIIINYQNSGYIECRINSYSEIYNFDSSSVELSIEISEGRQILVGEIAIEGNKLFSTAYILNTIGTKQGDVLNSITLNRDAEEILTLYEKKGYSFAAVNVESIEQYSESGTEKLRVKIRIDENEKVKIDNIVIEGNTTTQRNVIVREVTLDEGNTISRESLIEIQRRLENLGYFESVERPKILKYKNSTVLLINVKEGNTNTFDGIIGYVPPAQSEENGYFTGIVNLSIRNLFGTGRKVEARFQKEIKTTQELELKYMEPWLLGYPLNVNLGFLQRIEDSLYVKRDIGVKTEVMISKKFTVSLLLNYERVIPTATTGFLPIFDSRVLASGIELKFDSRDYVYNPYSGILYRTSYSVGQKKIYNAALFEDFDIPDNFTVQKGAVDLDFYYTFFKRQSSLISLHGVEIRSPRYETADLYRFGGIQSVRGYRDGQFLASRCGWSNIEVRYSLARRTFVFGFYDMGYYLKPEDDISKITKQEGFIFGYGLGIRLETALGMFGVSYALGRGDSILEGKIHFGLVNDF